MDGKGLVQKLAAVGPLGQGKSWGLKSVQPTLQQCDLNPPGLSWSLTCRMRCSTDIPPLPCGWEETGLKVFSTELGHLQPACSKQQAPGKAGLWVKGTLEPAFPVLEAQMHMPAVSLGTGH
jgi:hypothetical protein